MSSLEYSWQEIRLEAAKDQIPGNQRGHRKERVLFSKD